MRILGRLLVAGLVLLLALRLIQLWRRDPVDFGKVDAAFFVAAIAISVVAVSAYGLVWPFLLRRLGTAAPFAWITLFFKSQLGKYVPGSVWQYAGRVGLARGRGVPVQVAFTSIAAEIGYSALAAGAVSGLLVGPVAGAAILVGLAVVALCLGSDVGARLARGSAVVTATLRAAPVAAALYVLVWGLYGVAFWSTGRALFAVPTSALARYMGVFALAWLAGLVAVFAPGGIGVREAVIVALLGSRLGEANAIVLAATSRIVLTAIDLVAGAVAFGVPALRREEARPIGAGR